MIPPPRKHLARPGGFTPDLPRPETNKPSGERLEVSVEHAIPIETHGFAARPDVMRPGDDAGRRLGAGGKSPNSN